MSDYPRQVAGRITAETAEKLDEAIGRYHSTEGALVRAALEDFLPRFLAGGESREFAAKVEEATKDNAEARAEIEKVLRRTETKKRKLATA